MSLYVPLLPILVLGFVAGFSRVRFRWAPVLASAAALMLYALWVAIAWIWAASCWDCTKYHDSRGMEFGLGLFWFGIATGIMLVAIWLGALASFVVGHLRLKDAAHG